MRDILVCFVILKIPSKLLMENTHVADSKCNKMMHFLGIISIEHGRDHPENFTTLCAMKKKNLNLNGIFMYILLYR